MVNTGYSILNLEKKLQENQKEVKTLQENSKLDKPFNQNSTIQNSTLLMSPTENLGKQLLEIHAD